jgi:cytidine deaminase
MPTAAQPITASDGPRDDLVVGLVGAVGTDLPAVEADAVAHLKLLGYDVESVSLSGLMRAEYGGELPHQDAVPYDNYVYEYMTAGNVLRAHWRHADAVAYLVIEEIRRQRDARPDHEARACAFVLRSLKRPEEVRLLQEIYRGQFVLVGCHTPRETRIRQLADAIARSRGAGTVTPYRARAEQLADRDEHEHGPPTIQPVIRRWYKDHGQSVEDTFPLADAYINMEDSSAAAADLRRFLDLLLGSPFISPTREEVAMFHAGAAAVRSADMSRQVGAAIATADGDIIAIGCNEVPRAGGGAYWEGDADGARDFERGIDANQDQRNRAMNEVFNVLEARGLLTDAAVDAGPQRFSGALDDTRVDGLIEFTRSTHAEMAALLDAARRGVSVRGAILYASTFPCHNCAKHIVTAGISRVVFIEPYPKSLAEQLHGDAIAVDDPHRGNPTVDFEHFAGVAPVNYFALFKNVGKRKERDGSPKVFSAASIRPKLRGNFHRSPLVHEEEAIKDLETFRTQFGSPTRSKLADAPVLDRQRPVKVEPRGENVDEDTVDGGADPWATNRRAVRLHRRPDAGAARVQPAGRSALPAASRGAWRIASRIKARLRSSLIGRG